MLFIKSKYAVGNRRAVLFKWRKHACLHARTHTRTDARTWLHQSVLYAYTKEGNKRSRNRLNGFCESRLSRKIPMSQWISTSNNRFLYYIYALPFLCRKRGRFILRPFPWYRIFNSCKKKKRKRSVSSS